MKIYDKNIYKTQQTIKATIIIIVSFIVGFFVGYLCNTLVTNANKENNENIIEEKKVDENTQNNDSENTKLDINSNEVQDS